MSTLMVTGGAGFIGSNFVLRRFERSPRDRIVVLDALTYAGNLDNLSSLAGQSRFRFVKGSIEDPQLVGSLMAEEKPELVVHFAAESHVDRSILGPRVFTVTNVLGTQVLLDAARANGIRRFLMVSTDEVYGSLGPEGTFTETTPLDPSSPYSASKAAADLLCLAYQRTFGLDVVITRCSNNYGPRQFPEKLIPLIVLRALKDNPLPVYGDGMNVRDWIHVADHCAALDRVLEAGRAGEVYNIGSRNERTNIELVRGILKQLGKPESLIQYVKDRPAHDRRYSIDPLKVEQQLGWKPEVDFKQGLASTVEWYLSHRAWWEPILSGEYTEYYARQYGSEAPTVHGRGLGASS